MMKRLRIRPFLSVLLWLCALSISDGIATAQKTKSTPFVKCDKFPARPKGTLSGPNLLTYMMNRQPRNVCSEPFYLGAHRGAHTQNAQLTSVAPGVAVVDGTNYGNHISVEDGTTPQSLPENIAQSYSNVPSGINVIEVDPRRTKDGVLVMNHDPYWDRIIDTTYLGDRTGQRNAVADYNWNSTDPDWEDTLFYAIAWSWDGSKQENPWLSGVSGGSSPITLQTALNALKATSLVAQVHIRNTADLEAVVEAAVHANVMNQIYFDIQGKDFCTAVYGTPQTYDSTLCLKNFPTLIAKVDDDLVKSLKLSSPSQLPKIGLMVNMYFNSKFQTFDTKANADVRSTLLGQFGAAGTTDAASQPGLRFLGMDETNATTKFNGNMNRWATWFKQNGFIVAKIVWYPGLEGLAGNREASLRHVATCHINENGYPQSLKDNQKFGVNCIHGEAEYKRATAYEYALGVGKQSWQFPGWNQTPADIIVTDDPYGAIAQTNKITAQGRNTRTQTTRQIQPRFAPTGNLETDTASDLGLANADGQQVLCASEGGICSFPGSGMVSFETGSGPAVVAHAINSIPCTLAAFGTDPDEGVTKQCYVTLDDPGVQGGDYVMFDKAKQFVLGIPNGSLDEGALLAQAAFDGSAPEQWTVSAIGNGYFQIINANSGLAITDLGNGTVGQYAYADQSNQWWKIGSGPFSASGGLSITNAASGHSLSGVSGANGQNVIASAGSGDPWILQSTDTQYHTYDLIEPDDPPITPNNYNYLDIEEGNYILFNRYLGSALDIQSSSTGSGAGAISSNYTGLTSQQWTLVSVDQGIFWLLNANSGLVLDGSPGAWAQPIQTAPVVGNATQQWAITGNTDGGYVLTNVATGQTLGEAVNNPAVLQDGPDASWILSPVQTQLPGGLYTIANSLSGLYASTQPLTPGPLTTSTGASTWLITPQGNGYYNITTTDGIEVLTGQAPVGTPVVLSAPNNSSQQLWQINPNGDGSYTFMNAANGLTASVGTSMTAGGSISNLTWAGNNDHQWVLQPVLGGGTLPDGPSGSSTMCANEGGTCTFTGTATIAFGSGPYYIYRTATNSIPCTIAAFGSDPNQGFPKACYVEAYTPPINYAVCAYEGGTCNFTGTATIAFGSGNSFLYTTAVGSIACTNQAFGSDPDNGVSKACYVVSFRPANIASGVYTLVNVGSELVLDDVGLGTTYGVIPEQWELTGATSQQWRFTSVGNGYFTITNVYSTLVLDDSGFSTQNGTAIWQWGLTGATNQQWLPLLNADGKILLQNAYSGRFLQINNQAYGEGQQSSQWDYTNRPPQEWTLVPVQSQP